jgi:hypothetical protein
MSDDDQIGAARPCDFQDLVSRVPHEHMRFQSDLALMRPSVQALELLSY